MSGFIKLFRSLKEWEWYDDHNATRLLVHLLISVNYKDKKWRGQMVKKGSMILSWSSLSRGCGLSVQQCRTAMDKLIKSGEVTRDVSNKYQVVSLVKWEQMQIEEVQPTDNITSKPTNKQQTDNKQITTTKEGKESKEREEVKKESARPTPEMVYQFFKSKGLPLGEAARESEKFFNHYESKGWKVGKTKMQKWKAAAAGWINRMPEFKAAQEEKLTATEKLRRRHGIASN